LLVQGSGDSTFSDIEVTTDVLDCVCTGELPSPRTTDVFFVAPGVPDIFFMGPEVPGIFLTSPGVPCIFFMVPGVPVIFFVSPLLFACERGVDVLS